MKNIRICLILALCLTLFAACANDDPIYGLGAPSTGAQTYPTDPDVVVTDVLPDVPATEPLTTEEATTEEDTHVCTEDWGIAVPEKPVIYLYPTEPTVCPFIKLERILNALFRLCFPFAAVIVVERISTDVTAHVRPVRVEGAAADIEVADHDLFDACVVKHVPEIFNGIDAEAVADRKDLNGFGNAGGLLHRLFQRG